jgi:hypothetical protein
MGGPMLSVAKAGALDIGRQIQTNLREKGINIDSLVDGTFLRQLETKFAELTKFETENVVDSNEIEMNDMVSSKED